MTEQEKNMERDNHNYVGELNEKLQSEGNTDSLHENFKFDRIDGPDHSPVWRCVLSIGDTTVEVDGANKKELRQKASKKWLEEENRRIRSIFNRDNN